MGTPEHHSQRGVPDLGTQTTGRIARSKRPPWQCCRVPTAPLGTGTGRGDDGPAESPVLAQGQDMLPSCSSSCVTVSVL